MFTIVPSKLRFVTLIAFLLKIFNKKVRRTPFFDYFFISMFNLAAEQRDEGVVVLGHQRSRPFSSRCAERHVEW